MASADLGTEILINRYRWRLSAAAADELGPLLERFPVLESLPGARVLKSNHFRTVFHLPGGTLREATAGWIGKVYRYTSAWDRFRYRFIRHRALQEWAALQRFANLGLPSAEPLAVAELRRGGVLEGGGLVVRFLGGTEPLVDRLSSFAASPGATGEARELLARTGKLLRRMHDHGVWHRDLHAGNILVDKDAGSLHIIDLHTCVFLGKLARWQRRAGVAKLIHSVRSVVSPEEVRVLVEAYGPEALMSGATFEVVERWLLRKVRQLQTKRLGSRSKRCFLPSTQFQVTRLPGIRVYHLRKYPASDLEPLWRREPPTAGLKTSPRGWVAPARLGGRSVCLKYRSYSLLEGIQALFESHRLRRAYAGGHALSVRGIPTPQVIALREGIRLGLVREAHLVTELLEDALPLDEFLFTAYWGKPCSSDAARRKHAVARAVGDLVRAVHDAELYPHDLSPQNLLVSWRGLSGSGKDDSPQVFLADLDHLYLWQRLSGRGRMKNLAEIANLPEGHVSTADRIRGLRAYARGDAAFLNPVWVRMLRESVLEEHLQVLDKMGCGELRRVGAEGA